MIVAVIAVIVVGVDGKRGQRGGEGWDWRTTGWHRGTALRRPAGRRYQKVHIYGQGGRRDVGSVYTVCKGRRLLGIAFFLLLLRGLAVFLMLLVLRTAVYKHGKTPAQHNEMGHLFPWQEWRGLAAR